MINSKELFNRATMRGLAEHLLYGVSVPVDEEDYDKRLDNAFGRFDAKVKELANENANSISDCANELIREVTDLYTEIGMQSGILMMMDLIKKTQLGEVSQTESLASFNYEEPYYVLFNAITQSLDMLDGSNESKLENVIQILKKAQCNAEDKYIKHKG